jgi:hypothetical protein
VAAPCRTTRSGSFLSLRCSTHPSSPLAKKNGSSPPVPGSGHRDRLPPSRAWRRPVSAVGRRDNR